MASPDRTLRMAPGAREQRCDAERDVHRPIGVVVSKRERRALTAMEAVPVAHDPRWAKQFTDNYGQGSWGWRSTPVRLTTLLWLAFLSLGIVTENPVVDAAVMVALFTGPVAALLVQARRDADAGSPAP
ncbi:hypothetical protein AN215_24720 [Streptomyces abyssalis]|uniref:DUF3040 domain-containing protein n=1 Tax=Streptomyces abyssalis TaxID=933944 RepID=A0A1E7JGT8_9ACTN|nr:hypothetical protein AN215_24720 [Streptomyces abyssalis]